MGDTSFKRRLKSLILPIVSIGLLAGIFLDFHRSNNYVHHAGDKERYFLLLKKTKGIATTRVFTKSLIDNARETYGESIFGRSKHYVDEPLDGLVDEISVYKPFSDKPSLDLTRKRDYDKFKRQNLTKQMKILPRIEMILLEK